MAKVFSGYVKRHCVSLIVNQNANVVFTEHFCNLLIGILRVGLIVESDDRGSDVVLLLND